ncbi:MAG: hypothetical protein J6T88_05905 [Bacteroidales bacterium]|nr:hypothetical protein [Bacteroidales bacterium]
MNLNEDNIELYLFRYKEGLLDAAENAEVERALATHPEWQELADLYDPELTLPAGATIPYADVESLRNGGPKVKKQARVIPMWTKIAAAACLLLFATTLIRFVGGSDGQPSGPMVAENRPDDTAVNNAFVADTMIEMTVEQAVPQIHQTVVSSEPTLVAEMQNQPETPVAVESPKADTNVYELDIPTLREINDPMDQEVLYANIINWQTSNSEPIETPSRRQPLRNIARKATSIIATAASGYEENRGNIEDAIEERIQSNQFVNSLIATLE